MSRFHRRAGIRSEGRPIEVLAINQHPARQPGESLVESIQFFGSALEDEVAALIKIGQYYDSSFNNF
jgi:hypothetical protein